MKPIIEIKDISKKYQIRDKQPYYSLRDSIAGFFKNPLNIFAGHPAEEYWALKDINIDINQGEIIGIIGKNGAGKSTLLKILSRITPPTHGEIIIRGRVASLLEVGTGFHPELTGRENIFLNGTLLGMTNKEISAKFKEIVDFAEIEQFIDTPVKHYSSGMYTRLAFAVAAHLEPDVLIVDEVLSVGDASFQKKSLGKMKDVSKQGRTVLFVSHNLPAILNLCQKGILLDKGKIISSGNIEKVVASYTDVVKQSTQLDLSHKNIGNQHVQLIKIKAKDINGKSLQSFDIRKPVIIEVVFDVKQTTPWFNCVIQVFNSFGALLFTSVEDIDRKLTISPKNIGIYKSECIIPGNLLAEGLFSIRVLLSGNSKKEFQEIEYKDAITFNIHDNLEGGSVRGKSPAPYPGILRPKLQWKREYTTKLK